jgi:glycosyltransferase involved in cell wall biosynthesis
MPPPLIIHTEASDGWGGQEMRVYKELFYMRGRGYRTALIAPKHSEIFKKASRDGFDCWGVKFSKFSRVGEFFYLWRKFLKEKPLMVGTHSSGDSWTALLAAKLAGVPVKLRYRHISTPIKNNFINRFIYKQADAIVTTGDCISNALSRSLNIPLSRLHTIATGIHPSAKLPSREAACAALQKELGLPASARFIGMAAVLRSWKGHRVLMKAFDSIASRHPDCHLILAFPRRPDNEGNEAGYKTFAKGLASGSRIHFIGHETLVFENFNAFECALLASTKNEGIPQSLLQAMFSRIPVIGTDVGGIPEIVRNGETGLLIPPCDEKAIAGAIEEILSNPDAALARVEKAYKNVSENYTMEKMGEKIEALIRAVASGRS